MSRIRAEIDWIEIEIFIQKPTNLKAMRTAVSSAACAPSAFVEVIDNDPNSATTFRFRLHDPNKCAALKTCLNRLNERFPFAFPPNVTAIEIAIDNYDAGPEQVADWYFGLEILAHDKNRRIYREGKGSGSAIPASRNSLTRKVAEGYQIGIGDKSADFYQHAYYKQTDHNKQPLINSDKHRARIEITLRGKNLPCQTLEGWNDFKFEALSNYFRFRRSQCDLSPLHTMILQNHQIGEKKTRNRKAGGTRLHNRNTEANPENEKIRSALRNLSRRWNSAHAGRPAKRNACGNSGNIPSQNPYSDGLDESRSNNYIYSTDGLYRPCRPSSAEHTTHIASDSFPSNLSAMQFQQLTAEQPRKLKVH